MWISSDLGPNLSLLDATEKRRAELRMGSDGSPNLTLYDALENVRAILGANSVRVVKTGKVRKLPESSLVLFDKGGKVAWQRP